jgi:putative membrane protein
MLGTALAFTAFGTTTAAAASSQDAMFAKQAAQAGMTEVQLAHLALQKSKNPEVVAFAHRMNADHSKANAQLIAIEKQKGMTPPSSLGAKNEAVMQQLQSESGATFNSTYLKTQLPAHRKVLALFQTEAADGKDADLVAFAKQTIPTIEDHISMDEREIAKLDSTKSMSMR